MLASPLARRVRLASRAVVAALLVAGAAHAQTGPFTPSSSWWVGPGGTTGFTLGGGGQITVDTNGDGLVIPPTDHQHALPAAVQGAQWTHHLTPSRTILYSVGPGDGSCPGGTTIYFHRIPPANGGTITLLAGPECIPNQIAFEGFFDQPQSWTQRVAFIVDRENTGFQQIRWFDLNTGAATWTDVSFSTVIEYVRMAPSGIAAWVHSDVSDGDNVSDWRMVSLCAATLGQSTSTGAPGLSQVGPHTLNATIVPDGSNLRASITHSVTNAEVANFPVSDCSPPPTLGACCLPDGSCAGGVTSGDCAAAGGTFRGAGSACATANCPPPPAPLLSVSKTGPASTRAGRAMTYVLTARNTGNASSNSVVVRDQLPTGTTFVRASAGGFQNGSYAEWSLGTLAAGAVRTCSLTVNAPCTGTSVTNATYTISGLPGGTVNGSPSVVTSLTSDPLTFMTLTTSSVALSPTPLVTGGRIRHTLQMTNTLAVPREDVSVSLVSSNNTTVDAVLNASGGTTSVSGSNLTWIVTVPASGSATLVFDALVNECRPPALTPDLLNRGLFVIPRTPCGGTLGFVQPDDTLWLAPPPVSVALSAPSAGAAQSWNGRRYVGLRDGAIAEFELRVSNTEPAPGPACTVTLPIPNGLVPSGNPPFVGIPPVGTTWDANSQMITWTGTPGPSSSIAIRFRALVDASAGGIPRLLATGDAGVCAGGLTDELSVVTMNPEPVQPHVTGLARYEGLWTIRPGLDNDRQPLVKFDASDQRGMTRSPRGDYWVVGDPNWRANPTLGEFEILPSALNTTLAMDYPNDLAWDAFDSTLVFAGYQSGIGLRVRRWKPTTNAVNVLYTSPQSLYFVASHVKLDPQRRVLVTTGRWLLRVPPGGGAPTAWASSAVGSLPALAVDLDGSYLVIGQDSLTGNLGKIARVDPASGAFTVLADASALTGATSAMNSLVVAPGSTLFAGYGYGGVVAFDRSPWVDTFLSGTGYVDDLEWVGGAPGNVDAPESAPGPAALWLAPPSPNPASGSTRVAFTLPVAGPVRLDVHDASGRRVRTLAEGEHAAGRHAFTWDGRDGAGRALSAGLYFVRMEAVGRTQSRKVVLAR